jgi:dipeptidyl aminopeptidase/acylaminoacyl peptidase
MGLASVPLLLLLAPPECPLQPGLFAAHGVSIGESMRWRGPPDAPADGTLVVPSPDGRSRIIVRYEEHGDEWKGNFWVAFSVGLSGRVASRGLRGHDQARGDILWSPDSRRVAVSLNGELFVLGAGGSARPLGAPLRKRLNPPKSCDLGRFSTVAAVKWLSANRLLVMARQLWEDSCPQKYRARFYEYDLGSGKIGAARSLAQAKRAFPKDLGPFAR